jgi:hypothetical protein
MTPSFDRDALLDYGIALARAVVERDGYLGPLADLLKGDRLAWRMSLDMDAKIDICFALSAYAAATLLGVDVNAVERRPLIGVVEQTGLVRDPAAPPNALGANLGSERDRAASRPYQPRTPANRIAGLLGRNLSSTEIERTENEFGTDKA